MPRSKSTAGSGAGQDRPPLAVWPCGQVPLGEQRSARYTDEGPGTGVMAPELARRIVTGFSREGAVVADVMCGSATVLVEAVVAGRRAVGLDIDAGRVETAVANLGAALGVGSSEVPVWRGDARHDGGPLAGYAGGVDLVVVEPPEPGPASRPRMETPEVGGLRGGAYVEAMGTVLLGCWALLRPGGYLVLVCGHRQGVGGPAEMVRCASRAGFSYIQHVIALSAPIRGEVLAEPATAPAGLSRSSARAAQSVCSPAHADVVVCAKPVGTTGVGR